MQAGKLFSLRGRGCYLVYCNLAGWKTLPVLLMNITTPPFSLKFIRCFVHGMPWLMCLGLDVALYQFLSQVR
ncbi:hypothetical protein EDB19DRAFT_1820444, partial [Suillus lakei]